MILRYRQHFAFFSLTSFSSLHIALYRNITLIIPSIENQRLHLTRVYTIVDASHLLTRWDEISFLFTMNDVTFSFVNSPKVRSLNDNEDYFYPVSMYVQINRQTRWNTPFNNKLRSMEMENSIVPSLGATSWKEFTLQAPRMRLISTWFNFSDSQS